MIRPIWGGVAGVALLGTAAGAGVLVVGGGGEEEAVQLQPPTAGASSSPTLTSNATPSDLPPPQEGYTWQKIPPGPNGTPGYAVQVPTDWISLGLSGNPVSFAPEGRSEAGPILLTAATPVSAGFEHPILFNLPMSGTTCGTGVPSGDMPGRPSDAPDASPSEQFAGQTYTWSVYYFACETRLTAADVAGGKSPVPFDVRAAEVRSGEFIFSVTAFEPNGSAASKPIFEEALETFTQR